MSDIIKGISNLIASLFQVLEGAVTAVVNTLVTTFRTAFNVIVGAVKSVFNLAEGVVGLVVGNFLILLTLIVAYFGYIEYQKRQGNRNPQPIKDVVDGVAGVADGVGKKLQ